jgi:hypothetical protein
MALAPGTEQASGGEVRDNDGRLIVVTSGGAAITGGGGAGGDPLSDGTPGGALPTRTLWIAGANGTVLQGLVADATGRLRTVVEGTPAVSVSNFPATQPVSGTVSVGNFPATQPVSGTVGVSNFPASQPVTGPLTDAQLRASAVPISGTFFQATQPVSAASLPLPAGAAQEHATAASPTSSRLTDGAAFYDARQTRALTATDVVTANQGAPATQANAWFTRPRKLATYRAVFRATAAPYVISNANTAGQRKQFATIFHAVAATKTVRIRKAAVEINSVTVACYLVCDLVRLTATTTPATGNPAITPSSVDTSSAAAEATCLTLPTTAGTEGVLIGSRGARLGITGTGSTATPVQTNVPLEMIDLAPFDHEQQAPAMRAGVAEGYAVVIYTDTATTVSVANIEIEFTED